MTCAECLRYTKCARAWKGTPRDDCYIPGMASMGRCSGCGILRPVKQSAMFDCPICAMRASMTAEQWAAIKAKSESHQAAMMEALS